MKMATAPAVTDYSVSSTPTPFSSRVRAFVITPRRKQRCWIFRVGGITREVSKVDLLASICKRYTTVKRLVVRSESPAGDAAEVNPAADRNVEVEVEFTGPLPSEGPGALLCNFLRGSSVGAQPVELPRGRKKRRRTDEASSETSDSDLEERKSRKMGGCRSTNNLQQLGKEDQDEEGGAGSGRRISVNPIFNGQSGSSMTSAADEPGTVWGNSGGAVASTSGLTPQALSDLFMASPISSQENIPSISRVSVPLDPRPTTERMPQNQPRGLSLDTTQHQKHMVHTYQQHQYPDKVQTQQQKAKKSSDAQRDDVVGCMSTPQSLAHSLESGSTDLSSSGHPAIEPDFDCLLVSPSGGGMWGSKQSESALLSPIPLPPPVQRSLKGWSLESSHTTETARGDCYGANMPMNLFHDDNTLSSTVVGETAAVAANLTDSARSAGSNADAGEGSRRGQEVHQSQSWGSDCVLPMEKVVIEPSPKECDFEGFPSPTPNPLSSRLSFPDGQCHIAFTGLERTGHDLSSLRVTAHFGVDSIHKVGEGTGPVKMGEDGRAYATVCYPSMREIWPELYCTGNVQVIQVDVVVEIRSDCGKYQYVGPHLKVAYNRTPAAGVETAERDYDPPIQGRQITSDAPTSYNDLAPQTSDSCEDYCCFDRLSDMFLSVFRGGGPTHQTLPEDPNDFMNAQA